MDLFHREREPENRELIWVKPFDNRMDEILRLKEKSETCPKEMKKVFLSAWGELASHVKLHQKVASQIVKSELPLNVYYNVTIKTDMASTTIDFLIISDELIVVVLSRRKSISNGTVTIRDSRSFRKLLIKSPVIHRLNQAFTR